MSRMKGLYSVLNHVPEKLQRVSNQLGDTVSRKVSLSVLDDVAEDFDQPVLKIKREVESLYRGSMSTRSRNAMASRLQIKGGSIFADNVGKVYLSVGNS